MKSGNKMKIETCAAMLALALVTGCASTSQPSASTTQPAAPVAAAPAVAPAAPQTPLAVPATARKKIVLAMTGPAAVTQAKDWASFKDEWRATFADHAKTSGIAFEMQQGEARATGEAGTLVNVYVNDYRMVGIGARIFLGVMTGNAYIDAKATFSDLNAGAGFGDRAYNTSSSAWSGVFGKMTPQQVDAIASQVFDEIKPR
jgi:hypothetical protein